MSKYTRRARHSTSRCRATSKELQQGKVMLHNLCYVTTPPSQTIQIFDDSDNLAVVVSYVRRILATTAAENHELRHARDELAKRLASCQEVVARIGRCRESALPWCDICYYATVDTSLICGHCFCAGCLTTIQWLDVDTVCPKCRGSLVRRRRIYL